MEYISDVCGYPPFIAEPSSSRELEAVAGGILLELFKTRLGKEQT